ncbi:hypothetical protein ACFXA3_00665 [Streptomyces sp. NPDC059456]|uniref:NucA/NucB deoxyribonuclease domain-containing protein n=1 Tax=Streptomyces sp. NPDC059456 TaxID=3346838 RepID=UPI00368877ED
MNRARRCLVAIVSLAIAATTLTGTAPPPPPTPAPSSTPQKNCRPTAPGSEVRKDGAVMACVESSPAQAPAATGTAGPARLTEPYCVPDQENGTFRFGSTRHGYCTEKTVTYTLYDEAGATLGTGVVKVATFATLDPKSRTWSETVQATATEVSSRVGALLIGFEASCSYSCTMDRAKAWGGKHELLNRGQSKDDYVTYRTTVANGFQSVVVPRYKVDLYSVGESAPGKRDNEWNGLTLRCDAVLADPGCIVSGNMANVNISIGRYGAAAITYLWAQHNLYANNFGTKEKPLERNADENAAKRKRYQTCDAAPDPMVRRPDLVPDDSCDEFPFAGSFQGGTNGAQCAEILPFKENGGWQVDVMEPRSNAPCVRSHVPNGDNTGAGGEYGRAVQSERILDGEFYTVTVTE